MEPGNEKPTTLIQLEELPLIVLTHLSKDQKQYLQFEQKKFKVIGMPQVKTYHIGSLGKGSTFGGGVGTALNDSWGIFGNMSSVNMKTLNQFRTDIQLRLEDEETHEKIFFEKSFPIEMTLSIEPGDTFSIFSVKAEMKYLNWKDDKNFLSFSPFIAQVDETKQLLPLGKVPQVIVPEPNSNEPPSKFEELLDKHPVLVPLFAIIAAIVIFFVLIELDTLISKNSTPPTQSSSTAQTITVQ